MKLSTLASAAGLGLGLAAPQLFAQSADELRSSGQAGERWDGYLEARDPAVQDAVDTINAERKALYEERAAEQEISVEAVGKIYAQQIYERLGPGSWFKQADGEWVQK